MQIFPCTAPTQHGHISPLRVDRYMGNLGKGSPQTKAGGFSSCPSLVHLHVHLLPIPCSHLLLLPAGTWDR